MRNPNEVMQDLNFQEKLLIFKDINELRETGYVKEHLYNLCKAISDEIGMRDTAVWIDLIQKTIPLMIANELLAKSE